MWSSTEFQGLDVRFTAARQHLLGALLTRAFSTLQRGICAVRFSSPQPSDRSTLSHFTSLTVSTLDGVCRLDTPDGCAAFVARCVVAAATPKLAHGEVARLHNRWLAVSARECAAAEARRVARERLAVDARRRARAGEAGPGRAAKRACCGAGGDAPLQ